MDNNYNTLSANDSITASTILNNLITGGYNIIAIVEYLNDEIAVNNKKMISFTVHSKGSSYNDIVINEIMYAPLIYEPEWIELYNRSDQKINLKKWEIGDRSTKEIITAKDIYINPHSFIIITKDSSITKHFNIPVEIIKTSIPSLNNDGDSVVLADSLGVVIDSLEYLPSWGGSGGYSLERIDKDTSSTLRSNWGSSVSTNKATPGLKNSIAVKEKDLGISKFYPEKQVCEINFINKLNVVVHNYAKFRSAEFSLKLFFDEDNDSVAQHNELIKTLNCQPINPKDSSIFQIEFSSIKTGINRFIATIFLEGDEDVTNNSEYTFFTTFQINHSRNDLIINEIMFAPKTPQPEWVEILNNSNKPLDINGFRLADANDTVTVIKNTLVVQPEEYFIIAADSSISQFFPQPYKLITANFPSLNNSGDKVILLDSLNRIIDSLEYFADWGLNTNGASLERKDKDEPSVNNENWGASIALLKATPGLKNSICVKENDLVVTGFFPKYKTSNVTGANELTAIIKNFGTKEQHNFNLNFFFYNNIDTQKIRKELIKTFPVSSLAPNDSISFSVAVISSTEGEQNYLVEIDSPQDEDTTNNKKTVSITWFRITVERNDLAIFEIMFAPKTPQPEWIEILNNRNKQLDIKGFRLADANDTVTVVKNSFVIQPGEYFIVAADSSIIQFFPQPYKLITANIPSLNNSGDKVILLDSLNRIIDSLEYFSDWGLNTNGASLERKDKDVPAVSKENWGTSIALLKATPGMKNSICVKENDLLVTGFFPKHKISNVTETNELTATIKNSGKKEQHNFNVNFFFINEIDTLNISRELIKTFPVSSLASNDSASFSVTVTSSIEGDLNYLIEIDSQQDEDTTNNKNSITITWYRITDGRNDLAISEIMYAPQNPQPEWIEIYNRSNKTINLNGYNFADDGDTVKVSVQNIIIQPGEYLVIASDSVFFNFFTSAGKVLIVKLPQLNNSGDKAIILDKHSRVIDSVWFNSSWGGSDGKSLERIRNDSSSTAKTNWKSSTNVLGATPGKKNSVSPLDYDIRISEIKIIPEFPTPGEDISLFIKLNNVGEQNCIFNLYVYIDRDLDSLPNALLFSQNNLPLARHDSVYIPVNSILKNIRSDVGFYISVLLKDDGDTTNNRFYKQTRVVHPSGSIVVNEIMYNPFGGEPEWIELFNLSGDTLNLKQWIISDVITTPSIFKIPSAIFPPKSYFIISRDSTIYNYHRSIPSGILVGAMPVLNNDEDGVVLKDFVGFTIDSVFYTNSFGGKAGHSVERKSFTAPANEASNWSASIDIEQSTPGRKNSIAEKTTDLKITDMFITPVKPYTGDSVHVEVKIKNSGSIPVSDFNVEFCFCNDTDKTKLTLFEKYIYEGALSPGDSCNIKSLSAAGNLGDRFLFSAKIIYAPDEDTTNNYFSKSFVSLHTRNCIVVNEVMYDPKPNEPEWIEVVNISQKDINLNGWFINDKLTTPVRARITNVKYPVKPDEYFIISKDSSFINLYPALTNITAVASFGQLNNTEDGVIIYDNNDSLITDMSYKSSWGGSSGISLEKITAAILPSDSLSWKPSLSITGSTPGIKNSAMGIVENKQHCVAINEIMYEPAANNCEYIELLNISSDTIDIGGWSIKNSNGSIYKLCDYHYKFAPGNYFVIAADSGLLINYPYLNNSKLVKIVNTSGLSLENSGSLVLIKDFSGVTIDSVAYKDSWSNKSFSTTKNKSLERISAATDGNAPANWSSCVDPSGGTPGKQNSLLTIKIVKESAVSIVPNPFSPDGDGFEDFTQINYRFTQPVNSIRIRIFDSKGRLVRTLSNNQATGDNGNIIFNGMGEDGNPLRIGIYVVLFEAMNNLNTIETIKTVVVIARKL